MLIRNINVFEVGKEPTLQSILITKTGQKKILSPNASLPIETKDLKMLEGGGQLTIMPGMLDSHVHGQGGTDFAEVGEHAEKLAEIVKAIGQSGTSYIMATLVSLSIPTLTKCLRAIDEFIAKEQLNPTPGLAKIVGVHLEGPFIAKNCKGAHDITVLQDKITLEIFEGIIKHAPHIKEWKITLDPELQNGLQFIQEVKKLEVEQGISVKIFLGHSNPTKENIGLAVKSGAVGFTHLGNACMETCTRETRTLGKKDAQSRLVQWVLENPESCPPGGVELIVDGVHLSEAFVTLLFDTIGKEKINLVTDALGPSGLSNGLYKLGTLSIIKEKNNFYLADSQGNFLMKDGILPDGTPGKVKSLAGSAAPLSFCIKTYLQYVGKGMTEKEKMSVIFKSAVINPRKTSLSSRAQETLPDQENCVIFNNQGELVISLCNGNLIEHLPTTTVLQ